MGIIGFAIAAIVIGFGVLVGRWVASRAFGIRGFRRATNTEEERGRPALAFARAGAAIAGIYLACVLLFVPGFAGGKTVIDDRSMRVTVTTDGPAARAGLENGDRIVGVNGEKPRDWDHLKKLVGAHPNEEITVDVERGDGNEKRSFPVTTVGPKILIAPFVEKKSLSAGEVLAESFAAPIEVVGAMLKGFVRLFGASEKPELAGPVAIHQEVGRAADDGASTFFKLIAALGSYQAFWVCVALLVVAGVMSILPRRNSVLPTSEDSS